MRWDGRPCSQPLLLKDYVEFQDDEEIVKNINDNSKSIRFELGTRVRHQLRIIPELKFFVDDSLDYVERIDELLKK